MGANELSASLWRERELLELLIFKLEVEQLLLINGNSRWLQHATREVEQVMTLLREAVLAGSVEVAALAREWGTDEDATLRELVAHAPPGVWGEIFDAHLIAMTGLTAQIKELRDVNVQFLRAAARSTQETLADLASESTIYDASGLFGSSTTDAHLVDKTL